MRALRTSLFALLVAACAGAPSAPAPSAPVAHDALDRAVLSVMREHRLPGGQVVIARDGQVLTQRAYGLARIAPEAPVTHQTRFRIASLSKPITSLTVHLLIEEGALGLDDRLLDHLGSLPREPVDPRWSRITVRHLLEHSGGFDRHASFDPMFASERISEALGRPSPHELEDILEVMLGARLDFPPGEDYAYSNFGYSLLGRVIETVTGRSYEDVVRERVLSPAGASRVQLGRTRPSERPDDEAEYVAHPEEGFSLSVFPGEGHVPTPDGGFYLRPMAAHGGWIASADDVARIFMRFDARPTPPDLVGRDRLELMLAAPRHHAWDGYPYFYAHGLFVARSDAGRSWFHDGSKPGTTAMAVRAEDGTVAVALFNGRSVYGNVSADLDAALVLGVLQ